MKEIRLNVSVLGLNRQAGTVIKEGDEHYDVFKKWAENKDRKAGVILCEFIQTTAEKKEADAEAPGKPAEEAAEMFKCDQCNFQTPSEAALRMHVGKKHPVRK